ncbi:MAG: hypothetical protein LBT89_07310 [Planctomycetaceae bacterium]|jgi:tetratricopeptide (TPR) repeat protein|nr:hypothetical protein [Planctomycetaceae bacterium]
MFRYIIAFCVMFAAYAAAVYAQEPAAEAKPAASAEAAVAPDKSAVPATSLNKVVDVGTEKPKITPIPGGLYYEWQSFNNIGAIEIDKGVSGNFQVMFDVPVSAIGKPVEPATNSDILIPLADYWIVRGKPERAIPLYRRGLQSQPDSLLFQNNLAMLLSTAEGKHTEALGIIDKALNDKKDNVRLLDSKGLILMNNGQASEAVPILERAVQLSCQFPVYCMHLAKALELDGREGGARRYFTQVRAQLDSQAPNMPADDKAMFDSLKLKYPNSAGGETPAP